ncbi:hypothetical protein [Streptomyces sp. NPDC002537]
MTGAPSRAGVLHTADVAAVRHTAEPGVCAVVVLPVDDPPWLRDVDDAVVSGALSIPRTVLPAVTPGELADWARGVTAALPRTVAAPLVDDMAAIAARVAGPDARRRVMVRALRDDFQTFLVAVMPEELA